MVHEPRSSRELLRVMEWSFKYVVLDKKLQRNRTFGQSRETRNISWKLNLSLREQTVEVRVLPFCFSYEGINLFVIVLVRKVLGKSYSMLNYSFNEPWRIKIWLTSRKLSQTKVFSCLNTRKMLRLAYLIVFKFANKKL